MSQIRGGNAAQESLRVGIDGYSITGDTNILHSKWTITWHITDPYKFKTTFQEKESGEVNPQTGKPIMTSGPELIMKEIFKNVVVKSTAYTPVDEILSSGKNTYELRVQSEAQKILANYNCGIEINDVQLTEASPPLNTVPAFTAVTDARSDMQTAIDKAKEESASIFNNAKANAKNIVDQAQIYNSQIVTSAKSDADNISSLLKKFPNDNDGLNIYLQQYHQEILAEVLSNGKVYIARPGATWYLTGPTAQEIYGIDSTTNNK
jgi:membrane protease subunit HflK